MLLDQEARSAAFFVTVVKAFSIKSGGFNKKETSESLYLRRSEIPRDYNKVKGLNQEMYSCNYLPQWYWKKGIHDAIIMQIDVKEFNYDYTEKNPRRNALVFRLDASYAMFDTEIKEIHFINFKNLSGDFHPEKYKESWWIEDELLFDEKKKRWEIHVILGNKYNINREIHFAFSHAQVIRK